MTATLASYPWLPRMIDKARASAAGTLGSYYRYPCPIDAACLDLLGIDANTFRGIATQADGHRAHRPTRVHRRQHRAPRQLRSRSAERSVASQRLLTLPPVSVPRLTLREPLAA
jgi:hypothetical protein